MEPQHRIVSSFAVVVDRSRGQGLLKQIPDHRFAKLASFPSSGAQTSLLVEATTTDDTPAPIPAHDYVQSFVLGDCQDAVTDDDLPFLGNGIVIRTTRHELEIFTSITGLPAAFLYRDTDLTVLASSIRNIADIPGVCLTFDPQGIKELASIGHPIHHRTLFKNISVVPAGTRLSLRNQDLEVTGHWSAPDTVPFANWADYIDAQTSALRAAVGRLELHHSFLSLTAGLDTRAIFALLTERTERIPTFTMSGERLTLDAKRARQLSDAYGFTHQIVSIDSSFLDRLPQYAAEASLLSGGLSSLGHAFEVHFYRSLTSGLGARISGNLGNQIGRSGTEGTGARNIRLGLLAPDFRLGPPAGDKVLWLKDVLAARDARSMLFLIQNENLHASLGNSCIGNHFAVQQTPYADRTLISQKLKQPPLPDEGSGSILKTRMRDLRHRFLGQPVSYSFQRRIVRDVGGFVANCPINWGWRARGGVSLGGLLFGGMAIADVVLGSRFGSNPLAKRVLSAVGVLGFSSFQSTEVLGHSHIRQFVADTLLSDANLQSGVLDQNQVRQLVDRDFTDKTVRPDIEFALDVALARQHFLR